MRSLKLPGAGLDAEALAAFARLRYVSDAEVGFSRTRNGGGFYYVDSRGKRVRAARQVKRFDQLAIPPAWREVWICRFAKGHLQATGRDSRKRKQYVYHERWSEVSNLAKFLRLEAFGKVLPGLRRTIVRDLRGNRLSRRRVLAGVVGVLDATSIRVGNEEYVAQNGSYGVTTLRDRHVTLGRGSAELKFVGKGGFRKQAIVDDKALVRLVKQARAVPGARLFQYRDDDGKAIIVTAADANDYLHEVTGELFTAKDFRTWKASAEVAGTLYEYRDLARASKRKRILKTVVDDAAATLGNTPTVCRKYYIHPGLLASYQDGSFGAYFRRFKPRRMKGLSVGEQVLQQFLSRWQVQT